MPRHRSSWRRRYGASYYPSRYYTRPPRAHYVGGSTLMQSTRHHTNIRSPRVVATTAMIPRGYANATGGYMPGGRAFMPSTYNMVSLASRLSSAIALLLHLPPSYRLTTCTVSSLTSNVVGQSDSTLTTLSFRLPGVASHLPSPRLCLRPQRLSTSFLFPPFSFSTSAQFITHDNYLHSLSVSSTWKVIQNPAIITSTLLDMASVVSSPTQASKPTAHIPPASQAAS